MRRVGIEFQKQMYVNTLCCLLAPPSGYMHPSFLLSMQSHAAGNVALIQLWPVGAALKVLHV